MQPHPLAPVATPILAAMRQIATRGGLHPLTPVDYTSLQACSHYLLQQELGNPLDLPPILPRQLAEHLSEPTQRELALQLLTVMAFVDGVIEEAKINLVLAYADALHLHDNYLQDLIATTKQNWAWVISDMGQRNIESITGQPWATGDVLAWLLPYHTQPDPQLEARFQALAEFPITSLGYQFWQFYQTQSYAFPGCPQGLNARFAVPHDCTHLLAGYDTTAAGEILVSTFTAAMHPAQAMAGHILPVIYSWHLGIAFNPVAGATTGALEPESFWRAWARGEQTTVDWFDPAWDFWAVAAWDVVQLRQEYGVCV